MEFVVPYKAIDYTSLVTDKDWETGNVLGLFKACDVGTNDLDEFLAVKDMKAACKFFMSHGPLLFVPMRFEFDIPQHDDDLMLHSQITLEAAEIMRFALNLRRMIDDPPIDPIELEKLRVAVDIDDRFASEHMTDGQHRFVSAYWERRIESEEYYKWLRRELLGEDEPRSDDEGNYVYPFVHYSDVADCSKSKTPVVDACAGILDRLVIDHLQDMSVVVNNGTPCLYPKTLMSALWYVAAEAWTKSEIRKCKACGNPFIAHRDTKSGANMKKYCNTACREKAYRERKKRNMRRAATSKA